MIEMILDIVIVASVGSLAVPVLAVTLAALGHFPPLHFTLFGREIRVGRPSFHTSLATVSNTILGVKGIGFASGGVALSRLAAMGLIVALSQSGQVSVRSSGDVVMHQVRLSGVAA